MAQTLILISHGAFCRELKKSTEMIMGPQDNILTAELLPNEGADNFKEKLLRLIAGLDDVLVFADLMGGTPCNVASRLLMEGHQFELYAGVNMPMVIGFINACLIGEQLDFKAFACDNIHHVNTLISALADDDDDD
ncbi:PTS sugar transporter subunit IIA [Streptococcus equi]|uniref:PTS sugar transporter subunit IIA n=1 Tax=Streptococcus equi TaxID=1336 RepID=UPI001E49094C|nr:PTS fructose transporter subunit IIA [Streptococcus equi]MCD3367751.1 PTS fructose transporter subunit IIA [Streptococcus equi subsp. zooepidemicus]MCD3448425.1 PTS fructose transporter subunit IIA [Streptococcus equi subsp. zooepidemicus]HEL0622680.1 PTS fructose transporter subunit IIA [Streptococcus equi subsp. zooepidemicus]HEL0674306.1 PTS fructose transporter subunit IIA [Streptococcus equi subsp. zooepidemicus]HEL1119732.1 PTS fructose transporter subunit IIA [Streptococcus equi subs